MTTDGLRRLRVPCLVVLVAMSVWLGTHAAQVGVEHDNSSLRSTNVEERNAYSEFLATFGSDEDILVAIHHPALVESAGLGLVADITARIGAMDGVRKAWSIVNAEEIVTGEAGAEPRALLSPPWDAPGIRDRTLAALERNPDFTGWLVSADRQTAGILVEIDERPDDAEYRARLIANLRALAPVVDAGGGEMHVTGVPVQKTDVSDYVDRDQQILLPAAVAVLGLVLALFFRHVSGVVVPLAVAGITVLWTLGAYSASGYSINAITALLPPVLLVVALASTVHVYDAWLAGHAPIDVRRGQGAEPHSADTGRRDADAALAEDCAALAEDRASLAVRSVFVPGLLCAVTTSQGFLSLMFGGDLPAVHQFGIFAAFGTVVAFLVSITVVPVALAGIRPPAHRASDEHGWTFRLLRTTSGIATRYPVAVLVTFGIVTLVLTAAIPRIRTNTDLVRFLRADAPLRIDTEWIDEHLAGTLPLDFVVRRTDGKPVLDLEAARQLEKLESAIREMPHVASVTSVLALVRQIHRAESDDHALALPADGEQFQEELDLLDESGHSLVRRFASPEMTSIRLTVRLHAIGSAETAPLVAAIRRDAANSLGPDIVLQPVGSLWEVVRDSENLVRQQVTSFASAIVLVVAAIGLLLRSAVFTIVAMIPNVMPILWTGGLMGYTGIELSTGTAMIASAVLGLVVDDTIHYLSYYRQVYDGDAIRAIEQTSRAIGAPVTVVSTSLVLGFWVGALGSFLPTIYFSLLTGLTMITGVVCDLLVLPASLVMLDGFGRRKRRAGNTV